MSGAVNPIDNPQAWDVVVIAGVKSPFVCEVGEFKRANEFDVKKGKGTYGSTITYVGRPPAKGSIKFYLCTAAHFVAWDSFRPLLKYDPTKKSIQAVDIYHPSLADINLSSVVTETVGNIVHAGQGLYTCTVEFLEYFPAPPTSAVATPNGSQTNGGTTPGTKPPSADDALQAQIAALLVQAQQP